MRVIGGRFKGRTLRAPATHAIRPTADRLRETLFNILAHTCGDPVPGARVIDYFAGTEALDLKTLSHNARHALFVEDGAEARALIRENVEALGVAGVSRIFRRDATRLGIAPGEPYDLAFLDPPYGRGLGAAALASLRDGGWLDAGALCVVEETGTVDVAVPTGFVALDRRTVGESQLAILRHESAGPPLTIRPARKIRPKPTVSDQATSWEDKMSKTAPQDEFAQRLKAVADQIEATLDALLGPGALPAEIHRPARLLEAMRYVTLGGGKRLRPFLVVETARALGAAGDGVLRAGAALEMIHCYSLVHDDLPAMDDDDLRRGRPTAHIKFDEATAILAGDSLLTYAFDVLADEATHPDAGVRVALVLGLTRASGIGGMAGGQALDLEAERAETPLDAAAIERLQAMKTGALLLFAVEAGAILGGADAGQRAALNRYGRALGAAFQIADDILDTESDAATLGKAAGKDAGRNKGTLVTTLGLGGAKLRRDALASEAQEALKTLGEHIRTEHLAEAARFTAERRS